MSDDDLDQVAGDPAVPTWVVVVTFALSLLGLALASYLTFEHFTGSKTLACADSAGFNCGKVTTSPQSYFLGIPVAVLGLFQFVAMAALCSPWGWRTSRRWVHVARLAVSSVGMAFVLWLVSAELLIIDAICLWCTVVHVVTFALFICCVFWVPRRLGWTEP